MDQLGSCKYKLLGLLFHKINKLPDIREVFLHLFEKFFVEDIKMHVMKLFLALLISLTSLVSFAQTTVVEREGKYYDSNGNLYSGRYTSYYDNGNTKVDAIITNGLPNGEMKLFYPTGKIQEIRTYSLGEKDGRWEKWNEKGIKVSEANFIKGKKHGKWYVWDDNGTLRYDMTYTDGEKSGTWIIFDENGKETSRKEY